MKVKGIIHPHTYTKKDGLPYFTKSQLKEMADQINNKVMPIPFTFEHIGYQHIIDGVYGSELMDAVQAAWKSRTASVKGKDEGMRQSVILGECESIADTPRGWEGTFDVPTELEPMISALLKSGHYAGLSIVAAPVSLPKTKTSASLYEVTLTGDPLFEGCWVDGASKQYIRNRQANNTFARQQQPKSMSETEQPPAVEENKPEPVKEKTLHEKALDALDKFAESSPEDAKAIGDMITNISEQYKQQQISAAEATKQLNELKERSSLQSGVMSDLLIAALKKAEKALNDSSEAEEQPQSTITPEMEEEFRSFAQQYPGAATMVRDVVVTASNRMHEMRRERKRPANEELFNNVKKSLSNFSDTTSSSSPPVSDREKWRAAAMQGLGL